VRPTTQRLDCSDLPHARCAPQLVLISPATASARPLRRPQLTWQGIHCNRKTVYQHLKRQAWLDSHRQRTQRAGRRHEDKVAMLQSNRRWACNITTFKLWSGQRLRLAVIINCADRMVIAWKFQVRLRALEIGELLREGLFQSFAQQTHQAIGLEFLTDNGPEFIAVHLQQLLPRLGLLACHFLSTVVDRITNKNYISPCPVLSGSHQFAALPCFQPSREKSRLKSGFRGFYLRYAVFVGWPDGSNLLLTKMAVWKIINQFIY